MKKLVKLIFTTLLMAQLIVPSVAICLRNATASNGNELTCVFTSPATTVQAKNSAIQPFATTETSLEKASQISPTTIATDSLLRTPTSVVATSTHTYVYDEYTKQLKQYGNTVTDGAGALYTGVINITDLIEMRATSTSAYILYTDSGRTKLASIDDSNLNLTQIELPSATYNPNSFVIKETATVQIELLMNNVLDSYTIQGSQLVPNNTTKNLQISTTEKIDKLVLFEDDYIVQTASNKVLKIDKDYPYQAETIAESTLLFPASINDIASNNVSACYLTSDNKIHFINNSQPTINLNQISASIGKVKGTKMCYYGTSLLISDSTHHEVINYDLVSKLAKKQIYNSITAPSITPSSFRRIITASPTSMYSTIDAGESLETIPKDTELLVLSPLNAYENYIYCLYTANGQNYYIFINKTANYIERSETASSELKKTIGANTNLYLLPSTIVDNTNRIIKTLPILTEVTKLIAEEYLSADGKTFVKIELESKEIGYVEAKNLVTKAPLQSEKIKCDARTKRDTAIYFDNAGSEKITEITKGTRIKLLEPYDHKAEYTKISYQFSDGTIIEGYTLSRDLNPDGISTLQILGIVLIVINIILLIILIYAKSRVKKIRPRVESDKEN